MLTSKKTAHAAVKPGFANKERTQIHVPSEDGTELVTLEVGKHKIDVSTPRPFETNKDGSPKLFTGGQAIFWDKVVPIDASVKPSLIDTVTDGDKTTTTYGYPEGTKMRGEGNFKLNLAFFVPLGVDIASQSKANRSRLGASTQNCHAVLSHDCCQLDNEFCRCWEFTEALDRYYAKMKTGYGPILKRTNPGWKQFMQVSNNLTESNYFPIVNWNSKSPRRLIRLDFWYRC